MSTKKDMKWLDAIKKVLEEEKKALQYTDIAELISEKGYRNSVGATPANTVNGYINKNLKENKEKSVFAKVGMGEYILRKFVEKQDGPNMGESLDEESVERKLIIEALGVYWGRSQVLWKTTPDIYGVQQMGANPVNFSQQVGIYLLHDGRETIYVGQAIEQPIGKRLYQHTLDRFSGRWDRFSWYGFYGVSDNGTLDTSKTGIKDLSLSDIANTLEGILIESMEPRQNRKKGNTFSGIEYLQFADPEIKRKRAQQILSELSEKI
jgi:hypothetical protein